MSLIDPNSLRARQELLKVAQPSKSGRFTLNFGCREIEDGEGAGVDGVADQTLIATYSMALDDLYTKMTSPGMVAPEYMVSLVACIPVFVFDTLTFTRERSPFWYYNAITGKMLLALPCRFLDQLTHEDILDYARVVAIHEAAHIFTYIWRQNALLRNGGVRNGNKFLDLYWENWKWFNEATALCFEALTSPDSLHSLPYCMSWSDCPDVPLDCKTDDYRGALFARFLMQKIGDDFLCQIWNRGRPNESAIQTIVRLLDERGTPLCSPDDDAMDLFTEYGLKSYCLAGAPPHTLEQHVYKRYGTRLITRSFRLAAGVPQECRGKLDHLAFRYYRIFLPQGAQSLTVTLGANGNPMKGALMPIDANRRPVGATSMLTRSGDTCSATLPYHSGEVDAMILMVANCDIGRNARAVVSSNEDSYEYEIVVCAG